MKTDPRKVTRLLVDHTTPDLLAAIPEVLSKTNIAGLDIETEDSLKHAGLVDVKGDPIDFQRSKLCGLSIYPNDAEYAFYVNLGHADIENRLPFEKLAPVLDSFTGNWVVHNLPFELAMLKLTKGYQLRNGICSMQLCVTAYNEDEYPLDKFMRAGIGEMKNLMAAIGREFDDYDKDRGLTHRQGKLFAKVLAKETRGDQSYNGFVNSIKYGYGLKQAVKSWFDYDMVTFQEALGTKEHMGQLTGAEAALYGADDAIWCMKLYDRVLEFLLETNPKAVETFFHQELPMCELYADLKVDGLKINLDAVRDRREQEREAYADGLRRLKSSVSKALPFPTLVNPKLADREDWYKKNADRYRRRIHTWASSPDFNEAFHQCTQVSSPVGNEWARERGLMKPAGLNLTHYMVTRTLFYDLLGLEIVMDKGKVQSDAEARQSMFEDIRDDLKKAREFNLPTVAELEVKMKVLESINELSSIDQRVKLYLNPYIHLIDPDTSRVYPTLSSMLNSRRMAMGFPNAMQLAKRGSSTYIRGFYVPDNDEDVIVSLDWSQIELVLIGELSGDPEFAKAYGQIPYEDLHLGAAADCLSVVVPGLDLEIYKSLRNMSDADAELHSELNYLFRSTSGEALTPGKAYKYWRTEVGKGANFNYWYSGALSTVGQRLGWSKEQMWEATERYRTRFKVAEEWRVETIHEAQRNGYVTLPDHHRRTRFEATLAWEQAWNEKMKRYSDSSNGVKNFTRLMINSIKRRAGNQAVNSKIQGTSATLAKRSSYRIRQAARKDGFKNFRFMMPIHDELVFNVHPTEAWDFIQLASRIMCDHPDIISNLKPDCTASVGRTFEPFNLKSVPYGQIEINEAPALPFVPASERDGKMSRGTFDETMRYLRPHRS